MTIILIPDQGASAPQTELQISTIFPNKEGYRMEFLVFIIYGIVVSNWIWGGNPNKTNAYEPRGYSYYKTVGVINLLISMIGLLSFNYFLRDKDIIPVWSFWVGVVGFSLLLLTGMFNIYRMMTTNRP